MSQINPTRGVTLTGPDSSDTSCIDSYSMELKDEQGKSSGKIDYVPLVGETGSDERRKQSELLKGTHIFLPRLNAWVHKTVGQDDQARLIDAEKKAHVPGIVGSDNPVALAISEQGKEKSRCLQDLLTRPIPEFS